MKRFVQGIPLSILVLVTAVNAQVAYDCQAGCSLDSNLMGPPVCGQDNLTYLNECLAVCQNVPIVGFGLCDNDDPFQESDISTDPQVITLNTMVRFDDYRFVGKRIKTTTFEQDAAYLEQASNLKEEDIVTVFDEINTPPVPDFRITAEGFEYKSITDTASFGAASFRDDAWPESVAPQVGFMGGSVDGDGDNNSVRKRRELVVIGQDTRVNVADSTRFPYRTIGQADFWWGEGGCTLTMISRTSALTAGHCVWNHVAQMPLNMTAIAPARYRDVNGNGDGTIEPFGTWDVDYVSVFGEFQRFGQQNFDMAVVTYKPRIQNVIPNCRELYPGDVVGYLGMDRPTEINGVITDSRLSTMVVTGYPGDYPRGQMATSGLCDPLPVNRRDNYLNHYCDTAGGNSGSAIIVGGKIVLGLHAHGIRSNNIATSNGGPMMTAPLYSAVYEWAGHTTGQKLCSIKLPPPPAPTPVAQPVPVPAPVLPPAPTPVFQPVPTPVAKPVPAPVFQPVARPVPAPVFQPIPRPAPTPVFQPIPRPAPTPVLQPVPAPVLAPANQQTESKNDKKKKKKVKSEIMSGYQEGQEQQQEVPITTEGDYFKKSGKKL